MKSLEDLRQDRWGYMTTHFSEKKDSKVFSQHLELFGIEAVSSLVLLFEKIFEKKNFFQKNHLIVADSKDLEKLRSFLHFKKPKIPWYELPSFPKPKSPYSESIRLKRRRWQTWAHLTENRPNLFLASPQALLKKTDISLNFYVIKKGGNFNSFVLEDYEEAAFVERAGEFSSRAFLIDIFSPAYDTPLRVQLSGDKIQSVHLLDKEFKRRTKELEKALIPSLYEWSFKGEDRKKLCAYLRRQEKALSRTLPQELFKSFSRGNIYFGFENLLNCLNETCSLDFFPSPPLIWLFEPEKTKACFLEEKSRLEGEHPFFTERNLFLDWNKIEEQQLQLLEGQGTEEQNGIQQGLKDQDFKDQRVEKKQERKLSSQNLKKHVEEQRKFNLFEEQKKTQNGIDFQEFEKNNYREHYRPENHNTKFNQYSLIKVRASFPKTLFLEHESLSSENKNFSLENESSTLFSLKDFSSSLFRKSKNLREDLKRLPVHNIVFSGSKIEELKKLLLREKILIPSDKDFFEGKNLIFLPNQIKESFFCQGDTAYLRAEDFMLKKKQNLGHFEFFRQRARALEFSKLEEGDLLVHRQHGVGEFVGLQSLRMLGRKEDFIILKYKEGDKLFVPAYKASQVKRYSRKRADRITKTLLDRLGSPKSWERKKSQAKKHIQSLAIELIELYRLRKQKKRNPFDPVQEALEDFSGEFPFTETPDQRRAIQEIMADMDRDQPMDRLLTADTGFGKTEVALRACFRALENHFQVCFLAPTTVLTLQHFENFKQRFKNTAFNVELLNRFVSKKQRENIFQKVKEGKIDLLIATHSVFSPRLSFKNLGLLILDEEHRFGVRQKERLFRFRKNLDVLSLSATPIPRTLNMALTGIKDISVISRPPAKRKAVKMILKGWDEGAEDFIVQACQKEKARGGQILFVHNRVRTLYQRAEQIQRLLPDFKMAIAKGQMENLDKIMLDFFEKKYDFLLSTNIIESGMDIPQANTLFIDRVHEMGLSQIYQLKGRVGRGAEQAYCYLLFPERDRLSVLARERLGMLKKYAGLGEAFQLALNDLENRGAGSLFGSEQSGHLQSLGEDLYFEILNEQLTDQKEIFIEPEIFLPFATGIPDSYIPEPRLRLLYYKNLSEALREEDRMAIQFELLEEFGPFPEEFSQLFFLLDIRDFCKKLLIKDFRMTKQNLSLIFHEKTSVSSEKILKILKTKKGKMLGDQTFKIPLDNDNCSKEAKQLLQELGDL